MNNGKLTEKSLSALLLALILLLPACGKTKPQSPSNRRGETQQDTAAMALVLMNQRLAEQADKEVLEYVRQQDAPQYALANAGYWTRRLMRTDNQQIDRQATLDIRLLIYNLQGQMLIDSRETVSIPEGNLIFPVVETLWSMNYGESAELVIPWYAAFGAAGNSFVPPYTNVKIIIETYN